MSAVAESRVAIAETRHMRRGGDGVESAACVEVEMVPSAACAEVETVAAS
jgi:hypothetical protein